MNKQVLKKYLFFLKSKYLIYLYVASTIFIFLLFHNIQNPDLQFWDEATNTGVIIESSESHNFIDLKYNSEYFWEKPPLYYYIGIFIYKIVNFINNNFNFTIDLITVLRIFTSISSIILSFIILQITYQELKKIIKIKKSIVLSIIFILFSAIPIFWIFNPYNIFSTHNLRSIDSDILQLIFIFSAYYFLLKINFKNLIKIKQNIIFSCAIGFFSGLAFLTKGPIGFLIIFLLFLKISIEFLKLKQKYSKTLLIKFFFKILFFTFFSFSIIVLPWHIYMIIKFKQSFIDQYLIYHQIKRASGALEGHNKEFLFYLKILLNPNQGFLLLPLSIITAAYIKKFSYKYIKSHLLLFQELLIGFCLLFFLSILGTKISWYILIVYMFFIIFLTKIIYLLFFKNSYKTNNKLQNKKNLKLFIIILLIFFSIINCIHIIKLDNRFNFQYSIKSKTTCFVTTYNLHRVFYFEQLKNKNNKIIKIDPNLLINNNKINEIKTCEEIIIDLHEIDKIGQSIINHNIHFQKHIFNRCFIEEVLELSNNYGKLIIRCE